MRGTQHSHPVPSACAGSYGDDIFYAGGGKDQYIYGQRLPTHPYAMPHAAPSSPPPPSATLSLAPDAPLTGGPGDDRIDLGYSYDKMAFGRPSALPALARSVTPAPPLTLTPKPPLSPSALNLQGSQTPAPAYGRVCMPPCRRSYALCSTRVQAAMAMIPSSARKVLRDTSTVRLRPRAEAAPRVVVVLWLPPHATQTTWNAPQVATATTRSPTAGWVCMARPQAAVASFTVRDANLPAASSLPPPSPRAAPAASKPCARVLFRGTPRQAATATIPSTGRQLARSGPIACTVCRAGPALCLQRSRRPTDMPLQHARHESNRPTPLRPQSNARWRRLRRGVRRGPLV